MGISAVLILKLFRFVINKATKQDINGITKMGITWGKAGDSLVNV